MAPVTRGPTGRSAGKGDEHLECNVTGQHVKASAHGLEGAAPTVVLPRVVAKQGQVCRVAAAREACLHGVHQPRDSRSGDGVAARHVEVLEWRPLAEFGQPNIAHPIDQYPYHPNSSRGRRHARRQPPWKE